MMPLAQQFTFANMAEAHRVLEFSQHVGMIIVSVP